VGSLATRLCLAVFALCLLGSGYLLLSKGGSGGALPPVTPVAQAAERTAEYPGARIAMTAGFEVPGKGAMNLNGQGAYNGTTGRFQLKLSGPGLELEEVALAKDDRFEIYMRSPLFGGQLPGGAEWMKIDLSEDIPRQSASMDPRAQLEQLGRGTNLRKLGTETVRGERTTRYRVTVDQRDGIEQLRDEGKDRAADALERMFEASGSSSSEVDVWVAGDQTIRRFDMQMPFSMPGLQGAEAQMTMEIFDFGVEPDIPLPADESVFDATDMARQGLEQLGR
jgi:hypothetical protein